MKRWSVLQIFALNWLRYLNLNLVDDEEEEKWNHILNLYRERRVIKWMVRLNRNKNDEKKQQKQKIKINSKWKHF